MLNFTIVELSLPNNNCLMKTAFFTFGLWLIPFLTFAQFAENFSGDSLNNEIWQGDTLNFIINTDKELQLLDEDPLLSSSYLVAEVATGDSSNWEFYVRQEFNPSASNFAKIYLASTSKDLNSPLNGYFVRIGGSSGDADDISLYRQSGTEETLLISGRDSAVALDPAQARIQVRRNSLGEWTLSADYTGGQNFVVEGMASDFSHPLGNYFGIVCNYTASRSDKFFFDEILIDPLFTDTRPPMALDLQILNAQQIDLLFDEPLDLSSAENANNYQINNGIGIGSASLDAGNPALVHLSLSETLVSQQDYTLTINGVEDEKNNRQTNQSLDFTFFEFAEANGYDILITEIYADPDPIIGLPATEYIELYNRSNKLFQLENFILADNGNEIVLPAYELMPDSYVIVYERGTGNFAPFGDSLVVEDLVSLNNDGDDLILYFYDSQIWNYYVVNMAELKKRQRTRSGHRLFIRNLHGTIKDLFNKNRGNLAEISVADRVKLQSLQRSLEKQSKDIEELDKLILEALTGDDDIDKEIAEKCDFSNLLQEAICLAAACLDAKAESQKSDTGTSSFVGSGAKPKKINLPKLQLPTFDGSPLEWITFWDSFQSTIGSDEDLNDVDKFKYLRSYLSGAAYAVIDGLSISNENYKEAVELLLSRFGSKQVIESSFMNTLRRLPAVKSLEDIKSLRFLYDKTEAVVRSLKGIGTEPGSYGTFITPLLMPKNVT